MLWFAVTPPAVECRACHGTGSVLVTSRLYWPETVIADCPFCDAPIDQTPVHLLNLRYLGREDHEVNPNKTEVRI